MSVDLPSDSRILVYVGLDLIGDAIIKLPFVRALRHAFPDGEIVWLAGKGPSAFRDKMGSLTDGLIDAVIDDAGIGTHAWEVLTRPLGEQSFDLVFDTQRRVLTTLILKRIRSRYFFSAAADFHLSNIKPTRKPYVPPTALGWQLLDLLEMVTGEPITELAPLRIAPDVQKLAMALLPPERRYVALAPGAGGRHKCWPLERYVQLARSLAQARIHPVIFLGPAEEEWHHQLAPAMPTALFPLQNHYVKGYAFRADITVALAARCNVGVANDSGVGHLIGAAGIPLISLFGPTDPAKFAPLTDRLTILRAQSFGGPEMHLIPFQTVLATVSGVMTGQT
jgi:ADP-heptose:LPS heptosyltransferase